MILKQLTLLTLAAAFAAASYASTATNSQLLSNQEVTNSISLENFVLGSGEADAGTTTHTAVIGDKIFHGPQYLPFHPTAATIYPRVIEVDCAQKVQPRAFAGPVAPEAISCDGFNWLPSMGRAEYLFVTPTMAKQPAVIKVPGPERIILKEVPRKKPME